MTGAPEQCQRAKGTLTKIKRLEFVPKNTSVRDSFEISEQQIPDTRSGNREGAVTKFESG